MAKVFNKLLGAGIAAAVGAGAAVKNKNTSNQKKNNKNSISTSKPTSVKTNTSYNGDYLTVDLNTDYTKLSQQAAAKGDMTSAARYEAMRNAKVNYLNSTGDNRYSVSNNYVRDYGYKNNQGGQSFTGTYNSISDLPSNWTTASINGAKYTRDSNGNIYNGGSIMGDGINNATGEFTFSNQDAAKKAAVDRYLSTAGSFSGLDGNSYDYILNNGVIDPQYITALQNGTVGEYLKGVEAWQAKIDDENRRKMLLAQERTNEEDDVDSSQKQQQVVDNNSFETDRYASNYLNDDYQRRKAQQAYLMSRLY